MELNLRGHVAFVTGGSSGIGRSTAMAFAREGAKVVIGDIQDRGEGVAKEIEAMGGEALFVHCDTSKESDVIASLDQVMSRFGRLDHAFNNAGIEGLQGSVCDCTSENWDQIIDVNLKGVWLCMKHEIPQMLKQGGGTIVNCSSVAGLVGFPNIPAYVASKHGVVGLTETAALEYAKSSIRVNAVCPGAIQTPMIDRFVADHPEARSQLVGDEPIGRMGRPEEVADAVLWLCSEHSSFVTGQAIAVDGGWVAQ